MNGWITGFVPDSLHRHNLQFSLALAFGLTSLALTAVLRNSSLSSSARRTRKIIQSPRVTLLPKLSEEEIGELPYPPDVLPGARNVNSPYGIIRVYEWGPEGGRKVLLVHGISTPCISLGCSLRHIFLEMRLVAKT